MTVQAADTSVRTSVVVEAPAERAFSLFTEGIGTWWPPEHHILEGELAEMVFEPRVGGHVYDRGADGSECRWARVLAYEPPRRFVVTHARGTPRAQGSHRRGGSGWPRGRPPRR
jgi:uncharacterized protein YndB with AHSA1/START domain